MLENVQHFPTLMPSSNVVIWIAMVLGNVKCGDLGQKALKLSQQM
jgi:hypothetical protein